MSWLSNILDIFRSKLTPAQPVPTPVQPVPAPVVVATPVDKATPMKNTGDTSRPDWEYLWANCEIDSNRLEEVKSVCSIIVNNKERYLSIERSTGVPWYLVGAIHYREADLDFKCCLHNGDPLPGPTRHVPRGRGPFTSWEAATVDALRYDGLDRVKYDGPVQCLILAEKYNGLGMRNKGEYTPYVWAGTNWSNEIGKYVADGHYDPNARELQLGVAAIIKYLLDNH